MQTHLQPALSPLPATMSTETTAIPHITFIHEFHHLSNFSGSGTETVHQFIQRTERECTRHVATSDKEKNIHFKITYLSRAFESRWPVGEIRQIIFFHHL